MLTALLAGCGGSTGNPNATNAPSNERSVKSPFAFAPKAKTGSSQDNSNLLEPAPSQVRFRDVAGDYGIRHTYLNAEQGDAVMFEATGGGCGWGDFDRNGSWDIFLNQAGDYRRPPNASQPSDQLFLNLEGRFLDVTAGARIREFGYSQGVAVGDFDNDGFDDVYVTNVGANTLWHNLGDGTFLEIAAVANVDDERWSSSAAWADLDADGDLDLYLNNYVQYDRKTRECANEKGERRLCHPREFAHWPDVCFMNLGDGRFEPNLSIQNQVEKQDNRGLGVAIADFNNDGLSDIYVANDTDANFLFVNQGGGQFLEQARTLGCAVSRTGQKQASMGVTVADIDHNGWLDLYVTHYENESNTFYESLGEVGFSDATAHLGMHQLTSPTLGFGTAAVDFDQNGSYELIIANGHVQNFKDSPNHKMRPQVLGQNSLGVWTDISRTCGPFFDVKRVARAVARCDFDNDGDVDIAIVHQNTAFALLENESQRGHWLQLQFLGLESNRRGIGCRVVVTFDGKTRMQDVVGGGSYAASEQPALNFGFGKFSGPCDVEVRWPSGRVQKLSQVPLDQELLVIEP